MPSSPSTKSTRANLDHKLVLTTAVTLADRDGVDALSMRVLARELGCGAMSLYNYFANKDELLAGMVDHVTREIEHPRIDPADWRAGMRASAVSAHEMFKTHLWASALWTSQRPGPVRLLYMQALLQGLREAGLSAELVYHGYHALTMHIVGFTLQEAAFNDMPDDMDALVADALEQLPPDRFGDLIEHIKGHLDPHQPDDEFDYVLDLILEGLERRRAGA